MFGNMFKEKSSQAPSVNIQLPMVQGWTLAGTYIGENSSGVVLYKGTKHVCLSHQDYANAQAGIFTIPEPKITDRYHRICSRFFHRQHSSENSGYLRAAKVWQQKT